MIPLKTRKDLKSIPVGTPLFVVNQIRPAFSRPTKIVRQKSNFFTLSTKLGEESHLFNAPEPKAAQIQLNEEAQTVTLFAKDGSPYCTLYFSPVDIARLSAPVNAEAV